MHESLGTSFVLIDALVDDLCEGGFSGVVEVALREADCCIMIAQGKLIAAAEQLKGGLVTKTSVAGVAERARSERGRVSVYRCSAETTYAMSGRLASQPLYNRLSTDFADIDKMISKLSKEQDREWFVEIDTGNGLSGIIHVKDHQFRAVTSSTAAAEGKKALQRLLEECKASGATFDVFFKPAGEPAMFLNNGGGGAQPAEPSAVQEPAAGVELVKADEPVEPVASGGRATAAVANATAAVSSSAPGSSGAPNELAGRESGGQEVPPETDFWAHAKPEPDPVAQELPPQPIFNPEPAVERAPGLKQVASPESSVKPTRVLDPAQISALLEDLPTFAAIDLEMMDEAPGRSPKGSTAELLKDSLGFLPAALPPSEPVETAGPIRYEPGPDRTEPEVVEAGTTEAPAPAAEPGATQQFLEMKRLMGEIAGAIESAARVVEPRDTFSIYLRAGQLKIADRYPFLDPFGNEFEYHAGQIVFAGDVSSEVFREGATEALRLAVVSVVEASSQPANLRVKIEDDLYALFDKLRLDLERHGLDRSIQQIIG
ncbi:MAG TPA: hypothetical protein VJX67_14425 [Blastocatellia bacterium]|nr:hypothetical protein [Blastocatellia bacterium]